VAQIARINREWRLAWRKCAQIGGETADSGDSGDSAADDSPRQGGGTSAAGGVRELSSNTHAHGGFFVPASLSAAPETTAAKRRNELEGMRMALPTSSVSAPHVVISGTSASPALLRRV
jgi:hypothetical protein